MMSETLHGDFNGAIRQKNEVIRSPDQDHVALTAAMQRLGVARIVGMSLHSGPRHSAG
jgi:hypothetical protein